MGRLDRQVVLVTGGGRGIGRGICLTLAGEGATVVVNYPDSEHREQAEQVVQEILSIGGSGSSMACDISVKAEIDQMMAAIQQKLGGVDLLVNNAGICPFLDFFDIDEENWYKTVEVNLSGLFFCSQAAARQMRTKGKGSIINISTVTSHYGGPRQVHYAASKGGVNGLTSSMACALGKYGIRVNAILCGGVPTDINREESPDLSAFGNQLPLGRMGTPEDIGKAVLYFASEDSSWVTGSFLAVDGGSLIKER